eukprot:scaffold1309_cov117-Isochrysis_galbana.AAC.20
MPPIVESDSEPDDGEEGASSRHRKRSNVSKRAQRRKTPPPLPLDWQALPNGAASQKFKLDHSVQSCDRHNAYRYTDEFKVCHHLHTALLSASRRVTRRCPPLVPAG